MQLLIADDHTLFRDALVFYLAQHAKGSNVRVAPDLHGAMEILEGQAGADLPAIDLVLLDLRMPGMKGLTGLEKMLRTFPAQPVAILSGLAEEAEIDEAAHLGAVGYFPKTLSAKAMLSGIRQILGGAPYFARDHNTDRIMPSYHTDAVSAGFHETPQEKFRMPTALTRREKQVLALLADGSSNKLIAERLGLQVVTIKLHMRGICRKLGVANRTQAALIAREHAL